jgi:hypothetical protein
MDVLTRYYAVISPLQALLSLMFLTVAMLFEDFKSAIVWDL